MNGKLVADEIKSRVRSEVEKHSKKPLLACVVVDGNKASDIYVASKQRACEECGLRSKVLRLSEDVTQEDLENELNLLNADDEVSAILLQLPLPSHLNSAHALNVINPEKDVDCLTDKNLGKLLAGTASFAPCTATGIIKLLLHYGVKIEGKRAVVVGRSLLVGKSVACLLEQRNATVTLCHSHTKNLKDITTQADILVVAIGRAKFVTAEFVKEGAVVIDVGINRIDGKLFGDVDFDSVKEKASYLTPVPGGVGPLTVACLMENTLTLAKRQLGETVDNF